MPSRTLLTALAAAIAALSAVAVPAAGQASGYLAPRLKGTEHPDFNGLWQALNEANWDIQAHAAQPGPPQFGALYAEPAGPGIVDGNEIPYQAWALAKKKENFEKRMTHDPFNRDIGDPEAKCYLPGVPRAAVS